MPDNGPVGDEPGRPAERAGDESAMGGGGRSDDHPDGLGVSGSATQATPTGSGQTPDHDGRTPDDGRWTSATANSHTAGWDTRGPINQSDGGVSHRLVRRCRITASILLVIGAGLLLIVAVAPWNASSALLTLASGALLLGALLLLRRGSLWAAVGRSPLPLPLPLPEAAEGTRPGEHFGATGTTGSSSTARFSAPTATAAIGPPRLMSPGLAGAPIKRRLGSTVVPISASAGPSPGGGALVVHARADGVVLNEGDAVHVWRAGSSGLEPLPVHAEPRPSEASTSGRFALYRESDGAVFLGTTRLTDTW